MEFFLIERRHCLSYTYTRRFSNAFQHPLLALVALIFSSSVLSGADFRRGDVNADEAIDMSDAIFLLGCQFSGGECPTCDDAADANDDGALDISDASCLLAYLFQNGPAIPEPSWCGPDPTLDRLTSTPTPPAKTSSHPAQRWRKPT
jgi:hypothetical protein